MRRSLALPLLLSLALPALVGAAPVLAAPREQVRVVVQGSGAAEAVAALDGSVELELPLVDGVAASVPADRVDELERAAGVSGVTPNAAVTVAGTSGGDNTSTLNHVLLREIGADRLHAAGRTGDGVVVALVDTGVTPLPQLVGRLVPVEDAGDPTGADGRATVDCVDFSGEGHCDDSYGHGTFLAGLIAGSGEGSPDGEWKGVAPGARIVSVKIAGRDGSSDVSKVLAAIQWVVSFKDTYGIRVLNLSLGTDSTAPVETDPLNHAVQRAWRAGIAVVVSVGNRGPEAGTISKPADDPMVISVGAVDDRETDATSDDRVPAFSSRGPSVHGLAKPDVVAPGGRVVGLEAPGSRVAQLPTTLPDPYRRGSGTSMSAAVVSGLSALLLQGNDWSPDRLKTALKATATKVNDTAPEAIGAGLVQGPEALELGATLPDTAPPALITTSFGADLDATRGAVRVTICDDPTSSDAACLIEGAETAREGDLTGFRTGALTGYAGEWSGTSWYDSQWVGVTGTSWYGTSWYGTSWYGTSWYGVEGSGGETDSTWYGEPVPGSSWYGVWK